MKKIKMLCLSIMMLFVCTLGANAASLSFSENSTGKKIDISPIKAGYKYQWVHVNYTDYTGAEASLKAMVTEIKSLADVYNAATNEYNSSAAEYASLVSAGNLTRPEQKELYNEKIDTPKKKVDAAKKAYDEKCDEFYAMIEAIAPRNESNWTDLTTSPIPFDSTGYVQADAAVIWVDTNSEEHRYEAKIYMYEENTGELKAEVDCPIVNNFCQVVDNTYYGPNGTEVTKEVYENSCLPKVCKKDGDKFYGLNGTEVTEKVFKEECETTTVVAPICEVKDGKYYDDKGNSVTKEAFEKACPKSNPKTGYTLPIALGVTIISLGILGIIVSNKRKMFNQV